MKDPFRRLARRLFLEVMARRRRAAVPDAPVPAIAVPDTLSAVDEYQDGTLLHRRIEILERHVMRETDRSRQFEGSHLLRERASAQDAASSARPLESLEAAFERRSSLLADRILALQRDLDAYRTVTNELSRDAVIQRTLTERALQTLDAIASELRELREATASAIEKIGAVQEAHIARIEALSGVSLQHDQNWEGAGRVNASLIERIDGLTDGVQGLDVRTIAIVSEVRALQDNSRTLQGHLEEVLAQTADLVNSQRVAPFMTKPVFPANGTHRLAAGSFDYLGFEEIFRGTKDLVRERQRVYHAFVTPGQRIIDLGSGRGEFLELAREAGASAVGVDLNPQMVEACLQRGLDVREADALVFLRDTAPESADLIFSAQFIEHLLPDDLYALFLAARRTLVPGGLMIAETVNPQSIEALKCFYVDLMHVKPLFPEVMLFFARSAGFSNGQIFYPTGGGFNETQPWNRGEYALIATA